MKSNHGGKRKGAGNVPGQRVSERRTQVSLTLLPSIFKKFRMKHGRHWNRKVESLIKKDLE